MNNGEILFLYDAQLANPNGDPDDENRPRMDYETRRNLVTDVRLKRYIRDYLQDTGNQIFIENNEEGKVVNATKRLKNVLGSDRTPDDLGSLVSKFVDIRIFGATITIQKKEGKQTGDSIKITGPVQFTWGYSLNEVDLVDTYSITSKFSSGDNKSAGTIGKDYRVYYSLIGFYGSISGHRVKHSGMVETDLNLLDRSMIKAIPQQATRSKIGQFPRLYMRFLYKDQETIMGDWREQLILKERENLRGIGDVKLELENLVNKIKINNASISKILYWVDPSLDLEFRGKKLTLEEMLKGTGVAIEGIRA